MKKKILIGLGIFFGLIVAAIAAAVIYFWPFIQSVDWSIVNVSNMKALYVAFTQDEETINNTLKEIDDQRSEEIKSYLDMEIRDFTEEELQKIESGEVTKTQLIAQIVAENVATGEETVTNDAVANENVSTPDGNVDTNENTSPDTNYKTNETSEGNNENKAENKTEEKKEDKKGIGQWIQSLFTGKEEKKSDTTNNKTDNKNNVTDKNMSDKPANQTDKNTNNNVVNEPDKSTNGTAVQPDKNANDKTDGNVTGQTPSDKNQSNVKATADQIVAKHIAQLYSYYSQFQGRVDSLASSAKSWVKAYRQSTGCTWKEAKAAGVKHFTGTASQIETDCYAKVDAQIAALRKELSAIGADPSIADSVAASAYSEMEAKKSQIVQQGMAKLNK